ncbi:MAG: hypothetical protein GC206_13335 [Alphaproteobacteria bacterium]|nr:hypothetical protein [Alphaproteobacteria bacterium]
MNAGVKRDMKRDMKLGPNEKRVLQALRVYGPLRSRELVTYAAVPVGSVWSTCDALRDKGLVSKPTVSSPWTLAAGDEAGACKMRTGVRWMHERDSREQRALTFLAGAPGGADGPTIAAALGVVASGGTQISTTLGTLRAAALVERRQFGRRATWRITAKGRAFLEARA